MTTFFTQRIPGGSLARASALGLLALAAVLLGPSEARAQWTTSGTNTTTTNNVGIGTVAPSQMFHVHSIGTWAGTRVTTAATGSTINDGVHFGYDDSYGAYIWNREATSVVFSTSNLERMRVSPTGNIGIGTTTPGVVNGINLAPYINLHVQTPGGGAGSIAVDSSHASSGFVINGSSQPLNSRMWSISQGAGGGKLSFATHTDAGTKVDRLVIDRAGNVGVGTVSPASPLTVNSDSNVTPLLVTGNNTNVVGLAVSNTQTGSKAWALQVAGTNHLNAVPNGSLILRQATDDINSLVISKTGDIGVGTATPGSKLHVVGNITVTGNINAKYQDVAEWVPSTQKLAAGTVVILDTGRDNHVLASKGSYDTRVAGVISAQPGLSLGEKGEGKVLVATTGRVKVKVDATRAPIRIGDLIVTSDVEGLAMKSVPVELGGVAIHRPGTLIGKALESLEKGTGEILVLLSLQ